MGNIQIIETPKGEKMVIMPWSEYQRLCGLVEDDDARDVREADTIMARVNAGKSSLIFHDAVKAIIIDGVHPLRAIREQKGLTAAALAKKAGLARTTITQIETGKRAGTVAAYAALARALGVSVESLLDV